MELCERSAYELSRLLRKKEISAREITESVLSRIEEKEPLIHAYITVTGDLALEQADRADQLIAQGGNIPPLTGIPIAIKDLLCTRGIKTTCASKILANYIPPYNATVVDRLLQQNAVFVGKTNMDEFAMGSSTENSAAGLTRNPVDPERVPGGSSGGSAAVVAAGEAIAAIGSDTGGSIRQPASFCGIVGMKPTYGRVSRYGLIAYASSLDQVGPLCRSVEDCALLLNAISGHDRRDSTSVDLNCPDFLQSLDQDLDGVRIGLPQEYFVEGMESAVRDKVMEAVSFLEQNGAEIREVSLPHTPYAVGTYYLIATAEASSNLARYDAVKYGIRPRDDFEDIIAMYQQARSEGFGREVQRRIMLGTYVLSAGYYDAYYVKAQKARTLIRDDFRKAFEQVDCLVTPVSPCLPFKLGEKVAEPLQMYLVDIYTVSANLAGVPAMSINCGTVENLPVGLQVIGKPFDEEMLLRVAHGYQRLSGGQR
ncbi:MAG: Asp-tRNA(Asn)/Glu-tRNA(Gln) amidotransferase GatCAB subunit A [Deltaproteobacteria bacterium]|nr:MAG: aspartyl/glutamyl-tRNA amidotransferase subunit A [Desulfobacteraceae bacterium 4484_190.3]RLB17284.1 MAG: Asp-tRNA(Asn)/Glu-tRNA(Gln) amidotransferase GatCAB subunit A [Deltaproteobacteria bacterium]